VRVVRENSLALFFGAIFLLTLVAESFAGQHAFNEQQLEHGGDPYGWWRYVTSSQFGRAVLENWQSEYLQFFLFIGATIWLVQKGSPESKEPGEEGLESDEEQQIGDHARRSSPAWARVRDWRLRVYSNSLLLVMLVIFLLSWFGQSVTGWTVFNDDQRDHHQPTVSYARYLAQPSFWEATLQNWQSEFLAVGSFTIFAVYLRQRGSPESKPVGAPHEETGVSG
jgi:hypothetical protein